MDCYNGYSDYRHKIGSPGIGSGSNIPPYAHRHHPYSKPNLMRYPQIASMYHGAGVRPSLSLYDGYEQFGYQTPPPPPPPPPLPPPYAYNGHNFPYNQNHIRETGFYHHAHHPYDGYRMPPIYSPYHHHGHLHHNRNIGGAAIGSSIIGAGGTEHYNADILYGSNRTNGYLMRDTPPPPPPPYQYSPFHSTASAAREYYMPQHITSIASGGTAAVAAQSAIIETPPSVAAATIDNSVVHHSNESMYGEYSAASLTTPYPPAVGSKNAFSANLSSTGKYFCLMYVKYVCLYIHTI